MPQLFALFVGVARYHPESKVPHLTGCENDVNRMVACIRNAFPDTPPDNIRILLSEQATRKAVIENFIAHLCDNNKIAAGDTVLFYYSGHGSNAPAAPEFVALGQDTLNSDETLVLYDSRMPDSYDLADKELALLLANVNPAANMVVIADSCHSGSITRGVDDIKLGLPKFTARDVRPRQLHQYLTVHGRGYTDMHPLVLPKPAHLALSACDRGEVAYETGEASGLFTNTLLSLIAAGGMKQPYAQLYEYLYTQLKRLSRKQTPQLFVQGGFNTGKLFLLNEMGTGQPGYEAFYESGKWKINYGALHGLDTDPRKLNNYQVSIFKNRDDEAPLAVCAISKPGLEQSLLDWNYKPADKNENSFAATIGNSVPSLMVAIEGDDATKTALYALYNTSEAKLSTIVLSIQPTDNGADYVLTMKNNDLLLSDPRTGQVHGVHGTDQRSMYHILMTLQALEKWHRLERLENKTGRFPASDIEWKLIYDNKEGEEIICDDDHLTLDLSEEQTGIPYGFILKNNSNTNYYVALLHLSSDYGITQHTPPVDSSLLKGGVPDDDPLKLSQKEDQFILPEGFNEDADVFKLIISKEKFSDYFFEQDPILREITGITRATQKIGSENIADKWFVKTITVRTVRQGRRIDKTQAIINGFISIAPHDSFEAHVTLTPIASGTKDLHPITALHQLFEGEDYTIINLDDIGKSADSAERSVVELSGIVNEEALAEKPLQIELNYTLEEGEQAVAVTYDGEFVYVLDLLQPATTAGKQVCNIRSLPGSADDPRRAAAKSPLRAFWFCFLKLVAKKEDEVFKLRSIRYELGKVKYDEDDKAAETIDQRIAKAGKILLLVHGIIGNTKSIAQALEYLLTEKTYDLIITFDYENLNTPIEDIAQKLQDKLIAAGVSSNKKVDALVHSMGGLICRYMVEKKGGDVLINKMIMAGTPNGGSVFGKLPVLRDWLTGIVGLGINFGMKFMGHWGPAIKVANSVLKSTDVVTHTLAEMDGTSKFIKELNESKNAILTRYCIVAGDTDQYSIEQAALLKRFVEKSKLFIGRVAYGETPNDIAVSVKNILAVPTSYCKPNDIHQVGCHHMNYFEEEASLKVLQEIFRS